MSRIALLLWLAISLVSGSAEAQSEIRWAPDLATARRAAAQFQVPMLVHFYGDNCLPCKTLEQRVLNQDSVIKTLNKYFICVRINASQDRATAAEYQVHSWPTDVFVSADGQVLYQGVCKQDIPGYMEVLQNVAISNKDRNTLIAAERAKQSPTNGQIAGASTPTQQNAATSSLPPLPAQPSNTAFAAPPAIAASTPANQFQVAPPTRTGMMDSNAGLPPLSAHLASRPLGSDGFGSNSNVSGQLNAQTNLPNVPNEAKKPGVAKTDNNPAASLVSNPYFPESGPSEAMVCTPDGKCGPASSFASNIVQASTEQTGSNPNQQYAANQQGSAQNKSLHLVSNLPANVGPQFPPLSGNPTQTTSPAPTFQPRSAMLVANSTLVPTDASSQPADDSKVGLIEALPLQEMEQAAYSGYCPIALVKSGLKVQGKATHAVRHRGRTYLMESPEAVKEFLQAPDRYSPVLSGYDPMVFLEKGKLVDGSLEHALYDPNSGTVVLFASAESQAKFKADPARNTKALGYILNAANKK